MPFAWIKSTGIKWTAREKERSGRTSKEKDNCWRKAQGMGSEKEWTGKEKKVCTHTDVSFAKSSSCYSLSLPMFSHFLLDSFFSNPIFFSPLRDIYQIFCPLLSASLPSPSCGFHSYLTAGSHEVCISRPDLPEPWIFIC